MPFAALSPEGPVSLLGADPQTVERMRQRNRKEACFTAKCCGAPVVVRSAQDRAPHFMHKAVPVGCDGDRGETPEHRRLKQIIANEVVSTSEWQVETEAVQRSPTSGQTLWRADVLASRRRAKVAFEVQLSNADYELISARHERYRADGVRGLWFVRTKKGFPVTQEVPIFRVESDDTGGWVSLATAWDRPFICSQPEGSPYVELSEFVRAALGGGLKWAPYEAAPDTWLDVYVDYAPKGTCPGCGRTVAGHYCVRARVADSVDYPEFQFASGVFRTFRKRSNWYTPIIQAAWTRVREQGHETLRSEEGACCWCSTALDEQQGVLTPYETKQLACRLQLKDLPKPRFGTVERDWLRRWTVARQ